MKKILLTAWLAATPMCFHMALADQTGMDTDRSHPAAFVKDSIITTKIKSKLAAKHLSTLVKVKVDTDERGVVWLSGQTPNKDASDLAEMVVRNTDGVTSVHNEISVVP